MELRQNRTVETIHEPNRLYKTIIGRARIKQDRKGPYKTIQDHRRPSDRPEKTIKDHTKPYSTTHDNTRLHRTI